MVNPEMEVRVANSSKPDPSEPWRYVCPECKGQVHRNKSGFLYRCDKCEESYQKDELLDQRGPVR